MKKLIFPLLALGGLGVLAYFIVTKMGKSTSTVNNITQEAPTNWKDVAKEFIETTGEVIKGKQSDSNTIANSQQVTEPIWEPKKFDPLTFS